MKGLFKIFDWNVSKEERIGKTEYILSNIPLLISSNNLLYVLNII